MEDPNIFTVYFETVRALVTGMVFLYLLWVDRKDDFREWDGWLYLLNGFFFLTFATAIDITDNYQSLEKYIIIGPTLAESFLEKILGYLLGTVLLAVGFFKFMPVISNLKRETSAREKAEEFAQSVLSSVDEGFIVIDRQYRILSANDSFLERVNMKSEDVMGKRCYEISHHIQRPCYEEGEECAVKNTFNTGKPHTAIHQHFQNDGRTFYVEIKSYPLKVENGEVKSVIEVLNDITDKKNLEEQLLHAQKLEAVGQISGGIAHDFNNFLTAIIGYAKAIKTKGKTAGQIDRYADNIILASKKGASLTRSLLIFSRKGIIETAPVSLNDIVSEMTELFKVVVSKKIKLEIELHNEEIMIMADKGQIEQVVMNLVTNANDAMSEGGKLTIKTAFVKLGEEFIKAHNLEHSDRFGLLTVKDEGEGIDEERKSKIFEPFYTTKPVGKGTGLGLSMVYGIVKQHKGYINVESKLNQGTKFYVYFPETELKPDLPESISDNSISGNGETILLAEDDEHIRRLMRNCLCEFGYDVIDAPDGNRAVSLFIQRKDDINLVIVDYMMPGKTGNKVCSEIKAMKNDINILLISGYAADVIDGLKDDIGDANIMYKPVFPEKLLAKVKQILKKKRDTSPVSETFN